MTLNFPGPYEIRLFYTCTINTPLTHVARYNIQLVGVPDPGDTFDTITVLQRDGNTKALDVLVDEWVALMQAIYSTSQTTFVRAELWQNVFQSFQTSFVSTYALGLSGSVAQNVVAAGQSLVTFRTQEGGILKLSFMESIIASGPSDFEPFSPSALQAMVDYVLAVTNCFLARDTSFPIAVIGHYPGQNEHTQRVRWR